MRPRLKISNQKLDLKSWEKQFWQGLAIAAIEGAAAGCRPLKFIKYADYVVFFLHVRVNTTRTVYKTGTTLLRKTQFMCP